MKEGIMRYIAGSTVYEVKCEKALSDRFIGSALSAVTTDIFELHRRDDGTLSFSCMNCRTAEIESVAEECGVKLKAVKKRGLPHFIFARKRRAELLVGMILCAALALMSEKLIWEIRVSGNVDVPTEDILDNLEMNGFSEGTFYPGVDLEGLYHRFLLADKRISWIAVNIKGTVALVEVHEREILPEKTDYSERVNLVASRDGKIVRVDALFGGKEVKSGDYVTKGQLLVSSFFKTRASGDMFQSAKGHVYAETERVFEVRLPFAAYEKRYTGNEKSDTTYKILGKSFSLHSLFPTSYDKYDSERRKGYVSLAAGVVLPIKYETIVKREYKIERYIYSEEELKSLAYDEIYSMFAKELSGADILSAAYSEEISDGYGEKNGNKFFTLRATVSAIEDIAVPEGFDAD